MHCLDPACPDQKTFPESMTLEVSDMNLEISDMNLEVSDMNLDLTESRSPGLIDILFPDLIGVQIDFQTGSPHVCFDMNYRNFGDLDLDPALELARGLRMECFFEALDHVL